MSKYSKKDIFIDGLKLHTETFGKISNPACILIAGKMATGRFWSDTFCEYIANQGFFIIRYDHRDIGESSEIDWQKNPYSMSDLANDAILILNNYSIKKAHFIGNSMGGWICQRIGVDYPNRVLSLVIISAGPIELIKKDSFILTQKEQEILDSTSKLFQNRKEGKNLEENVENFIPIWRHLNAQIPLDEEMAKTFTIDFLTRTKNKNAMNHDLMMNDFLSKMRGQGVLKKIKAPTLVIHGDKDPVVLLRHGQEVADTIPKAKFVVIPGMGHSFFNKALEEKIAKLIVGQLKEVSNS